MLSKRALIILAAVIAAVSMSLGMVVGVFFIRDTPLASGPFSRDSLITVKHTSRIDSLPQGATQRMEGMYAIKIDSLEGLLSTERKRKPRIDTFIRVDTFTQTLYLPITSKIYSGENYKAKVSGVRPSLDWIEVYNQEKLLQVNTTTIKHYDNLLAIQALTGTHLWKGGANPFGALALEYRRGRLTTSTAVGIIYLNKEANTRPFITTNVKIDLLQRKF